MLRREINQKTKSIKTLILTLVKDVMEPSLWDEFNESLEKDGRGNYKILDNDLPTLRDLKTVINMLTAIARATERYSLIAVSAVKTFELPRDALDFRRNYKIFMSTSSPLMHYLVQAKDFTLKEIVPKLLTHLNELYKLCTSDNLNKISDFVIEQIISLEQYQRKYLYSKNQKQPEEKTEPDDREGFVTTIVKKNDSLLKLLYKNKYDVYFATETKQELNKPKIWDYYIEDSKDNDTLKHIKKLSNGLVAIKKSLDDYVSYKQSGMLSSITWIATFVRDLRRAYVCFQEFDYQAIIAEQANPFATLLKIHLKELHFSLEKLACLTDEMEATKCVKEGTLLKYVELLIHRYAQIASELRISVDYANQKRIFEQSRLKAREQHLLETEKQMQETMQLLRYRHSNLSSIPSDVVQVLQDFMTQYEDEIGVNRNQLKKYKEYLTNSRQPQLGLRALLSSRFEKWGNQWGLTLHYQIMDAIRKRFLYLENQKMRLERRLHQLVKQTQNNPYDYFKMQDLKITSHQTLILDALKKRANDLTIEKESLILNALPKPAINEVKETKESKENKEVKETKEKIKPFVMKDRTTNQIELKIQEAGLFSIAVKKYEEEKNMPSILESLQTENSISPQSAILLHEMDMISQNACGEQKRIQNG